MPASWKLLYKDKAGQWQPVKAKGTFGVAANTYNSTEFDPVETNGLRLEAQLHPNFSGGILEWRVE